MEFRILGSLEVDAAGERLGLGGPSEQKVLAALLLDAGHVVPVTHLVDTLWDDGPPTTAVKQARNAVGRLRRLLARNSEPDVVATEGTGYRIRVDGNTLDTQLFETKVIQAEAAASAGDVAEAVELLHGALGLWRGSALAGLSGRVIEAAAEAWDDRRYAVQEVYYEHRLSLGEHRKVVSDLRAMVSAHPFRERTVAQLMLALYRCGRQAEALALYNDTRDLLAQELGLDPGPDLQQLHQQVLTCDEELNLPAPDRIEVPGLVPAVLPGLAVPRQLPAPPQGFVGRSNELEALATLLDNQPESGGTVLISAIGGTAGIGKTALALHWAHYIADRFPDGQLYVNLRGFDPSGMPMPADDALAGFLRALGVPGQDMPIEQAERAAQYRSLLAGRRMLVILDNARSAEQVRPLLPGTPSSTVVVTSRDALQGLVARDGAQRLDLDLLTVENAVTLLRALIGPRVDIDPRAAAELAVQCSRLPLALRVAAEFAAARPGMPLTELTCELADQQRRLDLLNAGGDPRTAIRAVFSWSYRHLHADAARTFQLLGLHPGPDFGPYAIAALTSVTLAEAHRTLDELAQAHLIQATTPNRYYIHDLLRDYARELATDNQSQEHLRAALTSLHDHYLHTAAAAIGTLFPAEQHRRPEVPPATSPAPQVARPAAAQGWLDNERTTLVAVAAHAARSGWPGHAIRLASTLFYYLQNGDHYPEALSIHGHARHAARCTGDPAAEANALTSLGLVHWAQGRCRQASGLLQEALALHQRANDRTGQARTVNALGLVDWQQARYEKAASGFMKALALYRETSDRAGQATALGNLGAIDARQGRYRQAIECQELALAIFRDIGDRPDEATALSRLGVTKLRMGHYRQADEYLERALAISQDIGDREGQAAALTWLGDISLRTNRYPQATQYQQQALAISQNIGDRDGEISALNGLGEALLAAGQPDLASGRHTTALALAIQTGNKHQQARAYDGLGHVRHAVGDDARARGHWQQALALYTALKAPEANQVRAQLATTGSRERTR